MLDCGGEFKQRGFLPRARRCHAAAPRDAMLQRTCMNDKRLYASSLWMLGEVFGCTASYLFSCFLWMYGELLFLSLDAWRVVVPLDARRVKD